jgi:hypothetical protein
MGRSPIGTFRTCISLIVDDPRHWRRLRGYPASNLIMIARPWLAQRPVAESRLLRQRRERRVQVMAAEFDLRPNFQEVRDRA